MKKVLVILILIILPCAVVFAQKSKRKKPIAVVTVKAPKLPKIVLPKETDEGLWNEFESINDRFTIVFPAKTKDVFDDLLNDANYYQAATSTATYSVTVKRLKSYFPLADEINEIYDNVVSEAQADKIFKNESVIQNELLGRNVVFESMKKRFFVRFFGFENYFILASVAIDTVKYQKDLDIWVAKFLDSLVIKTKISQKGQKAGL